VNLYPQDAVRAALQAHHDGFAIVHHYLDVAIQEAAAQVEGRYPDLRQMHGAPFAGMVRSNVMAIAEGGHLDDTTLRIATVSNCGQHIHDREGNRYRILKRPLSQRRPGWPLSVSPPELDTLYGPLDGVNYTLEVLWSIDYSTKCLRRAVLAATAEIGSTAAIIYYEEQLPLAAPVTLEAGIDHFDGPLAGLADTDDDEETEGYGDFFDEEDEEGESS
jgi:hypothetical protein